jgi:putative colanic acid biosynthesis acetyltransferase WcaF
MEIDKNRSDAKYSRCELMRRVIWSGVELFFRFSPRSAFAFRASLLRLMGATVGEKVHIYNSARIYMPWNLTIGPLSSIGEHALIYNLGPIFIGREATVSQGSHLCAGKHDYEDPSMRLVKAPITVCDEAWVCADAFVGAGVTIGTGAVVGARGVVTKDVDAWTVVAGNPASVIKERKMRCH